MPRIVRIVIPPRSVQKRAIRVPFGQAASLSGYLGLTDGTPLAYRTVELLAAPRDGTSSFQRFGQVTTGPSGIWRATVPAGPSRTIEAVYGGSSETEPVTSAPVALTVPARIRLLAVTRRVPWGGTVRIIGQLYGGYLPSSGALVRLRYGFGRRARTTFGVLHVTGNGRFATTFTFGPGPSNLRLRYWFSASLIPHDDYPFAAASSARRYVTVGGIGRRAEPTHHRGAT